MGEAPDEFVDEKAEGAGVISMGRARWPERCLAFERADDGVIIENVHRLIERAESRLVREQLSEGDLCLPRLGEFRPEFCDPPLQGQTFFLENVQQTGAAQAFGGGPKEHEGVIRPPVLASGVEESAAQIDNRSPVLPDGDGRAEFIEARKVLLEDG